MEVLRTMRAWLVAEFPDVAQGVREMQITGLGADQPPRRVGRPVTTGAGLRRKDRRKD
jgi:hypothetical protein